LKRAETAHRKEKPDVRWLDVLTPMARAWTGAIAQSGQDERPFRPL
jgi:hypothetical protein